MNSSTASETRPAVLAGTLVVILFALPLFRGLDHEDLANDEAIYSYAVDSMVDGDSWPTPEGIPYTSRGGDPARRPSTLFLEKPPLKFWIVAAAIRIGILPHDEFGLRFWDALFAAIALVYVFLTGRRLVNSVCGLAAVCLLFIQPNLLFSHGLRANVMEAPLFLAYCAGIYHFLVYAADDEPRAGRRIHVFALAGWFVLGFMTKFVAALFLPMIVGCTALAIPDWRRRLWVDRLQWFAGGSVAFVLIAPWFIYETLRPGSRLWEIILGRHVVERMVESIDPEHLAPWYHYLDGLYRSLSATNVFLLVLAGVIIWTVETARRRWKGGLLILVWLLLPLAIVSIGASKLYHYFYPFLPAAALMGAYPVAIFVRWLRGLPSGLDWLDAAAGRLPLARARDLGTRIVSSRGARALFGATAALALLVALITQLNGFVRLEVFGATLLSNSSVLRPLIIASLALMLTLPVRPAALVPILAVFFFVAPFEQYVAIIERTGQVDSPLRTSRDCLMQVWEAAARSRSLIFVHLPRRVGLTHSYYYYYREFDRWERPRVPDDDTLAAHLLTTGQLAPTVILEDDYEAFLETVDVADPPRAIRIRGRAGFTSVLVVMPGPFAGCVDASVRAGAELYEIESDENTGAL